MTQRKLTPDELQDVTHARAHIRRVALFAETMGAFYGVVQTLESMATHGTTDGKPYVEPPPEIGDGYRVATEADAQRFDRQVWTDAAGWIEACCGLVRSSTMYRVPIDRVPTDEDAKQRPTVMVKDDGAETWRPVTLICVRDQYQYWSFVGLYESGGLNVWKQARFPYPGELD
jgi:hypothetical protein